jgi:hypothetical protein
MSELHRPQPLTTFVKWTEIFERPSREEMALFDRSNEKTAAGAKLHPPAAVLEPGCCVDRSPGRGLALLRSARA